MRKPLQVKTSFLVFILDQFLDRFNHWFMFLCVSLSTFDLTWERLKMSNQGKGQWHSLLWYCHACICPPCLYTKGQAEGGVAQSSPWPDDRESILSYPGNVASQLEQKVESGIPIAHWTREQGRIQQNCRESMQWHRPVQCTAVSFFTENVLSYQ